MCIFGASSKGCGLGGLPHVSRCWVLTIGAVVIVGHIMPVCPAVVPIRVILRGIGIRGTLTLAIPSSMLGLLLVALVWGLVLVRTLVGVIRVLWWWLAVSGIIVPSMATLSVRVSTAPSAILVWFRILLGA